MTAVSGDGSPGTPDGLAAVIAGMDDPENHGLPLLRRDYLLLLLATVAVPAILVLIGVLA